MDFYPERKNHHHPLFSGRRVSRVDETDSSAGQLKRLSGKEVFIEMKKFDPTVNVILTSSFLQDDRMQKILDLGVCGYIQKPYSVYKLISEIKRVLAS